MSEHGVFREDKEMKMKMKCVFGAATGMSALQVEVRV
jgi:hypothetical protein